MYTVGAYFFKEMMNMRKITVIGGDKRIKITVTELEKKGFAVNTVGLYDDEEDNTYGDVLLLPVPTTKDGETVFAPFAKRKIYLSEVADKADNRLLLTCNYSFKDKNCIDYGALDSYSLLNAIPTAEGAVKLAIENTSCTLWRSRVLVIGYGRVGKVLADRLKALGAYVTVSARKPADFALIKALGFNTIETKTVSDTLSDYDIVFNTVDVKVIDEKAFNNCTAKLLIDLSSLGGFDLYTARDCGITALKAPGLPGITAPVTAGKILAETVTEILNSHI